MVCPAKNEKQWEMHGTRSECSTAHLQLCVAMRIKISPGWNGSSVLFRRNCNHLSLLILPKRCSDKSRKKILLSSTCLAEHDEISKSWTTRISILSIRT